MAAHTTPAHFDEQQNLLAQLCGRKRVLLWRPADWPCLYPCGAAARAQTFCSGAPRPARQRPRQRPRALRLLIRSPPALPVPCAPSLSPLAASPCCTRATASRRCTCQASTWQRTRALRTRSPTRSCSVRATCSTSRSMRAQPRPRALRTTRLAHPPSTHPSPSPSPHPRHASPAPRPARASQVLVAPRGELGRRLRERQLLVPRHRDQGGQGRSGGLWAARERARPAQTLPTSAARGEAPARARAPGPERASRAPRPPAPRSCRSRTRPTLRCGATSSA